MPPSEADPFAYRGFRITRERLRDKYVVREGNNNMPELFVADSEDEALNWIDETITMPTRKVRHAK